LQRGRGKNKVTPVDCGVLEVETNSVTTPKLDPPPRIAKKRSGCDVGLVVMMDPDAVTMAVWKD